MAAQKKGFGFIITALVILLLGGGITIFLGISAFNSGKEFAANLEKGESFVTPETYSYTPKNNREVTNLDSRRRRYRPQRNRDRIHRSFDGNHK